MANPTPKALQDAAASLRSQATAARQAVEDQSRRRDGENQTALSKAGERQEAAQVSLKAAQARADDAFNSENAYRTQANQLQQDARTAAREGDAAKADDLNRQAANAAARSDEASARSAQAQREVSAANIEVAESQKALSEAAGELRARVVDPMDATTQISLMDEKAKLLDDASRKLELAPTVDNPVDRATLELDAEKMLREANGIQIITSDITNVTGQELKLPDINALPTDAPRVDDTSLMDPNADAMLSTDPTSTGASGQTGDELAAAPAAAAPLDDPLGVDAGAATATAAADGTQPAAAPLDDPLGLDSGVDSGVAATAAPDLAPAADSAPAFGGTDGDGATDDVGFGDGADSASPSVDFTAPDPTADTTAFASDAGTDFSSAPVPDDSASDDSGV